MVAVTYSLELFKEAAEAGGAFELRSLRPDLTTWPNAVSKNKIKLMRHSQSGGILL
jgi:hypothetical protein